MLEQLRQYFHRQRSFDRHLDHEISTDASNQIASLETHCVSVDSTDPYTSPVSDCKVIDTHQLLSEQSDAVHFNEEQSGNTLPPLTLTQQLQLGHCYFEQGQFDEAIVHYRHALAIDPNQTEIYQYLAESLSKVGNLSEAAASYRKAIEISSAQSVELNRIQKSEAIQSGNGAMKETMNGSRNGNSVTCAQKLEPYLAEAENAYQQEDWQETVTYCLRAVQVQPGSSAYKLLGNALQRLERFSEAVEAYLSAIQLDPQSADIYANLGSLYAQQRRWQDAIIHYQKAIALKPDFAGVYRNLSKVWSQLEQSDRASECWYRAFVLEPEQVAAEDWINLGNLLLQHNQIDEAIDCYRRAIDVAPHLAGGYQNLAEALVRQGKTQEAIPFYRKAQELGLNVASIAATNTSANAITNLLSQTNGKHLLQDTTPPSLLSHEPEQWNPEVVVSAEALGQLEPELVQTCRNLAESLHEKEKLIEVIRASTEALKQLEPELVQTCRNLAESLHEKGRLVEAIRCYQRVIELEPDSAADRVNLGSLYAQQTQWQAAIACYESAIALDANLASAHWNLAKVWEVLHDPKRAAVSFLRALTLEPNWASLPELLSLGHTLRSQNNEEAAIACYQQVIQRQVTCAEAHAALGEMFAHRQQWQDSITHYRQAILYCRNNLPYLVRLAQVFVATQQWQKAVLVYRQVIGRDPQSSHYLALAQCLEKQELWDEAIEAYQTSVTLHPHWQLCHKLGDLLNRQQRWQESVVAFRQAIELNPEYSWSHNNLGDALIHLERWQEAAEAFQKAIELHPDFHWSHYNLGEALAKLEDWDGAIGAYRKALELQPDLPQIKPKLGDALSQRAIMSLAEAANYYQQALQNDPDDVQNYHRLLEISPNEAKLYLELGNTLIKKKQLDGAIVFYKIGLQLKPDDAELTAQLSKVLELQKQLSISTAIPSGMQAPSSKSTIDEVQITKPQGFPSDLQLPPILGEGNDYTFIEERLKDFVTQKEPYTLSVSIILLAHHPGLLAKNLAALVHQTYPKHLFEVVVVSNIEGEILNPLVQEYKQYCELSYVHQKNHTTRGVAYNLGANAAKYQHLILLDYDMLPYPQLVEQYMQYFHVTDKAILIGHRRFIDTSKLTSSQLLEDCKAALESLSIIAKKNHEQHENDRKSLKIQLDIYKKSDCLKKDKYPFRAFMSFNAALPKSIFERVSPFDEDFQHQGFQDKEFGYRIYNTGYYFIPVLDAVALHQDLHRGRNATDCKVDEKAAANYFEQKCPVGWYRKYQSGATYGIPKVSIYVPSYNNGKYIRSAIDSVLNQTYTDIEVCIADDGSTDNTLKILEMHYKDHPKVRWITQSNGGIGKASNAAVNLCRGMYIGQLDSDDILKPDAVETLVKYLEHHNVGCVYSSCERIDAEGNYLKDEYSYPIFSREKMLMTSIVHHFRMFRKRDWLRTAGFNEELVNAVDYDMFLKLSEVCRFHHLDQKLYQRRWHGRNTSLINEKKQDENTYVVITHALQRMGLADEWEVYNSNADEPRKISFRRKQKEISVFFFPDYRKSNPYQRLLYSHIPDNCSLCPGTIDDALQALKGSVKKVIFHLHWINCIFRTAQAPEEADRLKNNFLGTLFQFLAEGGKLIWTIHNTLSHDTPFPNQEIELQNVIASVAHKIHLHSETAIPEIQQFFHLPTHKVEIIPHGNYVGVYPNSISRNEARQHFGFSADETVFLFLGQIRPYKGIEELLWAFDKVQKSFPNTRLVVAGLPAEPLHREELITNPEILKKITFVEEYIPDNQLQLFFNASDAVVLPYRKVLTSGSLLNAMSFSRPVIAPRIGMIEEVLKENYNGFLFELGDVESLAASMIKFAQLSHTIIEKFCKQSVESVKHLLWEDAINKLLIGIYGDSF